MRPEGYDPRDAALDGHLVSAKAFRAQLRLIKKLYRVITPEAFRLWLQNREPWPSPSILLTCDDGLQNVLTEMLPILMEEDLRCLFFVTGTSAGELRKKLWYEELFLLFLEARAGRFDVSNDGITIHGDLGTIEQRRAAWWDAVKRLSGQKAKTRDSLIRAFRGHFSIESRPEPGSESAWCRRFSLLTATELRQLTSCGMTVGAHSMSHPILSLLPPELAYAEISGSKSALESVLGTAVWAFAYPFGDPQSVNAGVVKMAQDAGFEAAFTNFGGGFGAALPQFSLPRLHITADMTLAELEAHVSGFHRRLQKYAGRSSDPLTVAQA